MKTMLAAAAALLVGFARMPADTFAPGPPSGRRVTPEAGLLLPFSSQPVQGFSSIAPIPKRDGWFYALADNGYGTKANSDDFLLRIYRVRPDWTSGRVDVDPAFIQLSDPRRQCNFAIVNERTEDRLLTGADFDPESLVIDRDGSFWIGEEFGPWILHAAPDGRLIDVPAEADGFRSPDNPAFTAGNGEREATVPRSRGFEGLAPLRQRGMLVAAFEAGPKGTPPDQTRLLEFDTASGLFTRRDWIYPFDAAGHSLTEFVADGKSFLAIERDNLQGPAARFKKVFRVELGVPGQVVRKTLVADLLAIDNPQRLGGFPATFTFPFITPEAVWPLDRHTILVVDDNNYPEKGGRSPDVRDDTEFIKLTIPQ